MPVKYSISFLAFEIEDWYTPSRSYILFTHIPSASYRRTSGMWSCYMAFLHSVLVNYVAISANAEHSSFIRPSFSNFVTIIDRLLLSVTRGFTILTAMHLYSLIRGNLSFIHKEHFICISARISPLNFLRAAMPARLRDVEDEIYYDHLWW